MALNLIKLKADTNMIMLLTIGLYKRYMMKFKLIQPQLSKMHVGIIKNGHLYMQVSKDNIGLLKSYNKI